MFAQIADDHIAIDLADDFRTSQHRPTHRLVGIGALLEMVEHDVVRSIVRLPDLL
jgi:hypothetical protein